MKREDAPVRELFIEELAEVRGGQDPYDTLMEKLRKVADWERLKELFYTTLACGEEGSC